jgi:hypothetical protein
VIAVAIRKRFGNFFVAIQAFECGSTRAELVAAIALCGSAQAGMRF